MRSVSALIAVVFLSLFLMLPGQAAAQSATGGAIVGTVTDPQAAAIAGATVEIVNNDTKQSQTQTTGTSGQYSFTSVPPGTYKISVTTKGFRTATVSDFKVEVTRSYTVDLKMELGEVSDVVQVEATARVELQTTDATVGNVLPASEIQRFPALTRQVNELLTLQPGATPNGEITGARADQSSFTLDGIDVTNNSVGGLGTFSFLAIDSIEEFRVSVANPSASFGRGAGGQVSLISRAGTDQYHGSTYWYHQNDEFNGNTWENGHIKDPVTGGPSTRRPELKDNRFGGRAGGPVPFFWHKKTFIFANYEGRRFPSSAPISRIVPTDTLRQGILRFKDANGTIQNYNLAGATGCGATGTAACDPRGLGLSPSIAALWKLLPSGNDPTVSGADGLNTTGFSTNVGTPFKNDFYDIKLDQNVTSKWHADASFRYFRQSQISAAQVNISGGTVSTVRSLPVRQNMIVGGLSGQITSRLTGDFKFGWVRERDATSPERPNLVATQEAIPGTSTPAGAIALDIGGPGGTHSLLDEPIDVGTQVARKQSNDNRNFQWNADFNWALGKHTWQFGTQVHFLPTLHLRDDKVIGALGALVAQLDGDVNFTVPGTSQPQPCSASVKANCLTTADVAQWDRLYAGTLGLIDNISVLAVRDGSFNPLPFGNQLQSDTKLWAPEMYVQDVWRLKPTLTLILGVNYGWQTAPVERLGRQTIQIDAGTGQPITAAAFLNQRKQAAANGQIFNPTFGFVPINSAKRGVFNVDYGDIGPRVAVAWNPSHSGGLTGKLFGSGKTVIRAGFGIIYDRQNTVQSVIIPALGVGFAQTLNISAPVCNITGVGGTGCNAASANPALGVFRVGQDGVLPVPVVPVQANPVVPLVTFNPVTGAINSPEVFSFQDDSSIKVGRNYAADLSIQRELPGNMILEVAFAGRHGRNLPQSMSLGQSPINFKDPASGQTFAQAFDALATELRAGIGPFKPDGVTPNPAFQTQPWFQNQVPGGSVALAIAASSNLKSGNVSSVFKTIDQKRLLASLPTFNNYQAQGIFFRSSTGEANYDALLVTLNKRTSHGLTLTANYTFSKSFDQIGAIQNAANLMPNSFDLNAEYGPSNFDYRHIGNAKWVYDLPFRSSNHYVNRFAKGWYLSGIFTAISGQPLTVTEGSQVWGGTQQLGFNTGAIPTIYPADIGGVHKGATGGVNLFADPIGVLGAFRRVLIGSDARGGRSNPLRGLGHWNLDTSVGKTTTITERLHATFAADFFNVFNHVIYCDPGANNPGTNTTCGGGLNLNGLNFGVLSSEFIPLNRTTGSRWIQLSARFEF